MRKVVDGHLHLFRKATADYPRTTYDGIAEADREARAEGLVVAMEAAGVDHAVVVPLSKEDAYLREVLRTFPGRFAGVGIFDHNRPDDIAGLEARLAVTAWQGLRFFGFQAAEDATPDSLPCFPVLEWMAERGMVIWFYGDLVQIRTLDLVMHRLPDLKVVLNHLGFLPDVHREMRADAHHRPRFEIDLPPSGLSAVEALAADHPNLYVHFSGHYAFSKQSYPYRDLEDVAVRLYRAFGAHRMLMASDWPMTEFEPGYARALGVVDQLLPDLTPAEREAVRGTTALSLFRF
jgi:predicted TIM-barrel fold metal-dependent hydrolase